MLHGRQQIKLTAESVAEALADYLNKHLAGVRVAELTHGLAAGVMLDLVVKSTNTSLPGFPAHTVPLVGSETPKSLYSERGTARSTTSDGYAHTVTGQSTGRGPGGDTLYATPTGPKVLLHMEDSP